ncbi:DMT family transporter [Paenibacillus sp. XY044]|uniref:DMT family transporter n=1 Tax=Paenibacillus sp. XY044 TaxID=2026089 RepID=UPI000B97D3AA|nr:DMT family transporter [Paenibacillus sp. XY044]OZB98564.1 hypothetical protein CJP46_05300 [Paenibacillus sp. XY044]
MMLGLVLSLIAGSLVSLQNIFNSKMNQRIGSWATTAWVLLLGFVASFGIGLAIEGRGMLSLQHMQPWYWFSGMIGVGVVFCLMQSMKLLAPTFAIAVVMTSQLGFALIWDSLGWMGLEKVPLTPNKVIGVLVIVAGIVVFKIGEGRLQSNKAAVQKEAAAIHQGNG